MKSEFSDSLGGSSAQAVYTDEETAGDLLNMISLCYVRQGNFERAAEYAKRCNDLDLKSGDPDLISSSYNTLAGIYMSARQPREAEKYILKALDYASRADNPTRLAVLNGMASEVYQHLRQYEQALSYATKACDIERQLGRLDKIAIRRAMQAAALIGLERYPEAREALADAIPGLRKSDNRHSLAIACNQMGDLLRQEGSDTAAVRYYDEALQIFLAQHDLYNESKSRLGLYEALRHSDPTQAMQHNDRYLELRDSLYDSKTGDLLSKYAAAYDNDVLRQENAEMQQAHRLYIIFGVALLVLIAIGAFLYARHMHRRQREQQRENACLQRLLDSMMEQNEARAKAETPDEEVRQPQSEDMHQFQLRIINIVNEQMARGNISVDALASELCLSPAQLRSRIGELSGETPKNFILGIRMQKARHLLTSQPSMPIGTVALRCGYEEKASFSRAFKRYFGCPPSKFMVKKVE